MAAEPTIAVLSITPDRWRNRAVLLYAAMADYSRSSCKNKTFRLNPLARTSGKSASRTLETLNAT
jgi:hypothetical protein